MASRWVLAITPKRYRQKKAHPWIGWAFQLSALFALEAIGLYWGICFGIRRERIYHPFEEMLLALKCCHGLCLFQVDRHHPQRGPCPSGVFQ